jgi:hypothetical protein
MKLYGSSLPTVLLSGMGSGFAVNNGNEYAGGKWRR